MRVSKIKNLGYILGRFKDCPKRRKMTTDNFFSEADLTLVCMYCYDTLYPLSSSHIKGQMTKNVQF